MKNQIFKSVRGMKDGLPENNLARRKIFSKIISRAELFGYDEINLPIVEYSEVFKRGIGLDTDVVNKEMYSFQDRNGEYLSLRPEGTAGCVRAVLENNLLISPPLKLWYFGKMFRYERPQKGRQRQFSQFGFELFGIKDIFAEFELICLIEDIWTELQLDDLSLEINSLGTNDERLKYTNALTKYFTQYKKNFDQSTIETLQRNPIRLLDSKNPILSELKENAPRIRQFLSIESTARIDGLQDLLTSNGILTKINPHLVRGLDYYSDIVFEWKTTRLGSQDAVCAGGRYDTLISRMGGNEGAAIGCAIGFERILSILSDTQLKYKRKPKVYLTATNDELDTEVFKIWKTIKAEIPDSVLTLHLSKGTLKSRLKRADKSDAFAAIIIGEDELRKEKFLIKPLRLNEKQVFCNKNELGETLKRFL